MVSEEEAAELLALFAAHSIDCRVVGGWGVDALVGEQTRPHKDLDLLVRVDDVPQMLRVLEGRGFAVAYLWPENRGDGTPNAFVMKHADGRELDVHAYEIADARIEPAWHTDVRIDADDIDARGTIGGSRVRCMTPQMQLRVHQGYELPDVQKQDVERLRRLAR